MPLETATYITDLNVSNPANADGLNQADDHMRMIKSAVKATFPNFTSAPLTSTQAQIDNNIAAYYAKIESRNGHVPAGMIMDFGYTNAPAGWLACDGQAVSRTTYADLFAAIGTTWGNGDGSTTFNVPGLVSRFRRHRDNSTLAGAVGITQSPANLAHTHAVSGTTSGDSVDHSHTFSGTTASMNRSNPHAHTYNAGTLLGVTQGGAFGSGAPGGQTTGSTDINHEHAFSGTTSGISAAHSHTFSVTSGGGSADNGNEARPYSATVLACIKT